MESEFIKYLKERGVPVKVKKFGEFKQFTKYEIQEWLLLGVDENGEQHWLTPEKDRIVKMGVN